MTGKRMLIDTSKCIGCKACQIACQQWHSHTAEDTTFTGSYQNPPELSAVNYNIVKFTETETGRWLFFKDQCRHCEVPRCLACPLGAIKKLSSGIVLINPLKCRPHECSTTEEKPCQVYCPYNIPKYKYNKNGVIVETEARKCDFCYNRFTHSGLRTGTFINSRVPACMLTCPNGVMAIAGANTVFDYAVKKAKYLRNHGYPNADIYPRQNWSWGPTRVLWITLDHPTVYALPVP
jgi:formate dehydrogenase iron-sulfur subunit